MNSYELDKRVTLQARGTAVDDLGQPVVGPGNWDDVEKVWAKVSPLSGRELMAAQANHSTLTHTVTIRYQAQFADPMKMATLRVAYGDRVFTIEASVDRDEAHHWLALSCAEGLNNG